MRWKPSTWLFPDLQADADCAVNKPAAHLRLKRNWVPTEQFFSLLSSALHILDTLASYQTIKLRCKSGVA